MRTPLGTSVDPKTLLSLQKLEVRLHDHHRPVPLFDAQAAVATHPFVQIGFDAILHSLTVTRPRVALHAESLHEASSRNLHGGSERGKGTPGR